MLLLDLSDELLSAVAFEVNDLKGARSLIETSKRLHRIALVPFYQCLANELRCEPLAAAVRSGRLDFVDEVWRHQKIVHQRLSRRLKKKQKGLDAALQVAVNNGYVDITCFLLGNGACRETRCGEDGNVLSAASSRGLTPVVQDLLSRGMYPNITGGIHGFPLRAAVQNGHLETARVLLNNGADVNQRYSMQFGRALEVAASTGREDLIKLLLYHGARDDLREADETHRTPGAAFRLALQRRHEAIVDILLTHTRPLSLAAGNQLVTAAGLGRDDIMHRLMDLGVDMEIHVPRACNVAAARGKQESLRVLLEAGVPRGSKYRALQRASQEGHADCVSYLIAMGAMSDKPEHPRQLRAYTYGVGDLLFSTPLQAACHAGDQKLSDRFRCSPDRDVERSAPFYQIVEMLLNAGADPNEYDGNRFLHPLSIAAHGGHSPVVRMLLQHGADPCSRGPIYGDNALQAAVAASSKETVRILLEAGATINGSGALQTAVGMSHRLDPNPEILKMLLNAGADVDDRSDEYACTAYVGNTVVFPPPGTQFFTALEWVRKSNRISKSFGAEVIQILQSHGAVG